MRSTTLQFFLALGTLLILMSGCQKKVIDKKPNILFCIADDASYPFMSAYGCSWIHTPAFDRISQEGLLFNNAYTPNAKCAPSRSCILTGRNSWQLEAAANHVAYFPAKFKTYAEVLEENGYFVGYTAKGWAPGDPGKINGKKRQPAGTPFDDIKTNPPTKFINKIDYSANFKKFLQSKPADHPFCFWYGSTEPHRAYEYGAGIHKGGMRITDIDHVPAFWPDNDSVRTDMLDYAYELEYFDSHVTKMLQMLDSAGELDNTVVVVTADNGMPFPRVKGQEYEYSNHLPLAIMWKKGIKNSGRSVNEFVNFIDFAPTFLELAGVKQDESGMQPIQGSSLIPIFDADKNVINAPFRDHALIGKERHDVGRPHDWGYPIRGIIKNGYLYIRNFEPDRWPAGNPETGYLNCDGSPTKTVILNDRRNNDGNSVYWQWSFGKRADEELYRISEDPACMNNLILDPEYLGIKNNLKNQMINELEEQGDPRMFGNGHIFDEYEYSEAASRNFYERYMAGEKMHAGWVNPTDFEKSPIE